MKVHVRCRNVPHTGRLERYIKWRLTQALDRIDVHIHSVTVQLGRLGRAEISCRVAAHLLPDRHLDVESRRPDVLDAVDRGVDKVAEAAARALGRLQSRRPSRRQWRESAMR